MENIQKYEEFVNNEELNWKTAVAGAALLNKKSSSII